MSIHSKPLSAVGRENFDQIFRKDDPARSLVPGMIREYRSLCCGWPVKEMARGDYFCLFCNKTCNTKLVEINS